MVSGVRYRGESHYPLTYYSGGGKFAIHLGKEVVCRVIVFC